MDVNDLIRSYLVFVKILVWRLKNFCNSFFVKWYPCQIRDINMSSFLFYSLSTESWWQVSYQLWKKFLLLHHFHPFVKINQDENLFLQSHPFSAKLTKPGQSEGNTLMINHKIWNAILQFRNDSLFNFL